jgi:hypothetical protein
MRTGALKGCQARRQADELNRNGAATSIYAAVAGTETRAVLKERTGAADRLEGAMKGLKTRREANEARKEHDAVESIEAAVIGRETRLRVQACEMEDAVGNINGAMAGRSARLLDSSSSSS